MNCFYHQDVSAIGICKSCSRGLCPDCAAEQTSGLACRGRCEEEVETLARLLKYTAALQASALQRLKAQRLAAIIPGVFITLFGAFFAWVGFSANPEIWAMVGLGAFLVLFGGYLVVKTVLSKAADPSRD